MSKDNINLGNRGEQFAVEYLLKNGYEVLKLNWRFGHKEIDIIVKRNNILIFIEVKTRTSDFFVNIRELVSKKQQNNLIDAADYYIVNNDIDLDIRFDIIGIISNNNNKIIHIKSAFTPEW